MEPMVVEVKLLQKKHGVLRNYFFDPPNPPDRRGGCSHGLGNTAPDRGRTPAFDFLFSVTWPHFLKKFWNTALSQYCIKTKMFYPKKIGKHDKKRARKNNRRHTGKKKHTPTDASSTLADEKRKQRKAVKKMRRRLRRIARQQSQHHQQQQHGTASKPQ